jgi:hypothetical protein
VEDIWTDIEPIPTPALPLKGRVNNTAPGSFLREGKEKNTLLSSGRFDERKNNVTPCPLPRQRRENAAL